MEAMWLLLCAWQAMQPSKWQIGEINNFFFQNKVIAAGENAPSVFEMTTSDASSGLFIDHIAWAYLMYLCVSYLSYMYNPPRAAMRDDIYYVALTHT